MRFFLQHWDSSWDTLKALLDRNADDLAVLMHLVLLSAATLHQQRNTRVKRKEYSKIVPPLQADVDVVWRGWRGQVDHRRPGAFAP